MNAPTHCPESIKRIYEQTHVETLDDFVELAEFYNSHFATKRYLGRALAELGYHYRTPSREELRRLGLHQRTNKRFYHVPIAEVHEVLDKAEDLGRNRMPDRETAETALEYIEGAGYHQW